MKLRFRDWIPAFAGMTEERLPPPIRSRAGLASLLAMTEVAYSPSVKSEKIHG
jgi:hypothetical protein